MWMCKLDGYTKHSSRWQAFREERLTCNDIQDTSAKGCSRRQGMRAKVPWKFTVGKLMDNAPHLLSTENLSDSTLACRLQQQSRHSRRQGDQRQAPRR